MKKRTKNIIIILILIVSLTWFYKVNSLNYKKHIEIKRNIVKHPEKLPTKETALKTSFWFKNLKADIYWLETIQYIWWNAVWSEYKKYLFTVLDIITELNPYFEKPYSIGQLLLPSYNSRYEDLTEEEQEQYIDEAIAMWQKWVKNFCDPEKVRLIKDEDDLQKIWTDDKYKNPCSEYRVPYYLAYIYYYYKKDPINAAWYYKVTSAIDEWMSWSRVMAAIMSWKWWDRQKAYFMFLNIAKYIEQEDTVCLNFASNLEKVGAEIFLNKSVELNWTILKNIEETREKAFWEFSEEQENDALSDTRCMWYLNKATRELNLEYIERAEEKFEKDKWYNSYHAKELFDEWYMDYLPTDFQQYENQWVIYKYSRDTWNYDYEMWRYEDIKSVFGEQEE